MRPGRPAGAIRRALRAVATGVLVVGALAGQGVASPVHAADDQLLLVSSASYRLDPDAAAVRVIVDITATNEKPNRVEQTAQGTRTTRYFFEAASIVIHAEADAVRATSGGRALATTVTRAEGYAVAEIRFRSDIYYKQSAEFTLSYTLPGGAPRSDSDIRVGSAFATFYAWAFGDRGDVLIVVPAGFEVETSGSTVAEVDGTPAETRFAATGIASVTDWYVVVVADRRESLTQERLDLAGGERLVVRAWPEDEEWRSRVGGLLRIGLPVLVDKLGLDWPVEGEIEVAEVHTPLLEGYAGVFYTDRDLIEISEDLDELTIIHEASHAWFNARLFVGRWINEGFADEYAARVLDEVSVGGLRPDALTPDSDGAVRLNEWSHPGRIADEETDTREHFGYSASWIVVRALIDEIGEEKMQAVLAAADARTTAYVGAAEPEVVGTANDWRRFLDLLEEAGGSDRADELFRRWVVAPEHEALIAERAAARAAYAGLVEAGDGWLPGYVVRDPLGRWQFATATERMEAAEEILAVRDEIEAIAGRLAVDAPASLESAYEAAESELDGVRSLADRQVAAIRALESTASVVAAERDALTSLGLAGETPEAALASALAAFEADDMDRVTAEAAALTTLMDGAPEAGRTRAVAGGAAAAAVVGLGAVGIVLRRRRRVPASAIVALGAVAGGQPGPGSDPGPEPAGPYATLGGQRTDEPAAEPTVDAAPPGQDPAGGEES